LIGFCDELAALFNSYLLHLADLMMIGLFDLLVGCRLACLTQLVKRTWRGAGVHGLNSFCL